LLQGRLPSRSCLFAPPCGAGAAGAYGTGAAMADTAAANAAAEGDSKKCRGDGLCDGSPADAAGAGAAAEANDIKDGLVQRLLYQPKMLHFNGII
ncbi:hypothetical protein RFZ03_05740, partial [Acinetobacter baumannii]|nr:hypothetical protein [Acinetobacter baumannii]